MEKTSNLQLETRGELTPLPAQEPSVAMMLQGVIAQGVSADNVAALDRLCGLYERMQDKNAERAFAVAFADLQSELPTVAATKPVPNKDGSIRYHFAPYEEIMGTLKPFLTAHGFSISFNSKVGDGRITVTCTLLHRGGHSRANDFAVRIGGGPPGATETQADGAAKTYAKRGSLCDALNIVVDHDDDGRALGEPITQAEAEDLRSRCKAADVDEAAFLKYAQSTGFEAISRERLEDIEEMLLKKEIKAGIRNRDGSFPF